MKFLKILKLLKLMNNTLYRFRRALLKLLIPNFVWKKFIFIDGIKIHVRDMPYSVGLKFLLSRKPDDYEKPERLLVNKILKHGDNILEMGGSIGILTRIMANSVGAKGRVISIEASKAITSFSKKFIESEFKNTTIVCAIGIPLFRRINILGKFQNNFGFLGGRVNYDENYKKIKTNNQDSFFVEDCEKIFSIKPNVLVIDIEGSEEILLKYKPDFPDYIEHIIIELHTQIYSYDKYFRLIDLFLNQNFQLRACIGECLLFGRKEDILRKVRDI